MFLYIIADDERKGFRELTERLRLSAERSVKSKGLCRHPDRYLYSQRLPFRGNPINWSSHSVPPAPESKVTSPGCDRYSRASMIVPSGPAQ